MYTNECTPVKLWRARNCHIEIEPCPPHSPFPSPTLALSSSLIRNYSQFVASLFTSPLLAASSRLSCPAILKESPASTQKRARGTRSTHMNKGFLWKTFNFRLSDLKVSVYLAYDILNSAPLQYYDYLINPANESLVGTRFAYFPVGGPVPPVPRDATQVSCSVLSSSHWGGMEAGENMLYSVQVHVFRCTTIDCYMIVELLHADIF